MSPRLTRAVAAAVAVAAALLCIAAPVHVRAAHSFKFDAGDDMDLGGIEALGNLFAAFGSAGGAGGGAGGSGGGAGGPGPGRGVGAPSHRDGGVITGEDAFCHFKCSEDLEAVQVPGHVPVSNGCGPAGINLDMGLEGAEQCCNEHDHCYHTCGNTFRQCEDGFSKCLDELCQSLKSEEERRSCQGTRAVMQMGTGLMGCGLFLESQEEACMCPREDGTVAPSLHMLQRSGGVEPLDVPVDTNPHDGAPRDLEGPPQGEVKEAKVKRKSRRRRRRRRRRRKRKQRHDEL